MIKKVVHFTYKTGRRIIVAVVGTSVLLVGIVMIVAPGPAFIVIPVGLTILAIEFVWARHWLKKGAEDRSSTPFEITAGGAPPDHPGPFIHRIPSGEYRSRWPESQGGESPGGQTAGGGSLSCYQS